jgi:acyl-CoA reductase-like NAD-dependent aldehyde dehydrogenase
MGNEILAVSNPSTGTVIREIPVDSREEALAKLEKASQCFSDRKRLLALHERISILEHLFQLVGSEEPALAALIAEEGGKPLADARVEASRAKAGIRIAINVISAELGNVIPLGHQAASAGRTNLTRKFPRGVVLAFSAFNHPLNLIVHQVIPAFAAGCPCVVKPASDTPLSCLRLVELMHQAGVPEDYVQASVVTDLEVAGEMVASERIAFFSFIGSSRVGWMLRSQLHAGVRCALEHGGVAPAIVTPSAGMDIAVPSITKGGFYHAGQVCVSTQRVYVHSSVYDNFVESLSDAVSALIVGDARDANTEVGPLIRPGEVDRVQSWVNEAVSDGARANIGGARQEGNFFSPTVMTNVPVDARLSTQEVFGPVVCVYPYNDLEDALNKANLHPYAFQAAIYTAELDDMYLAYEALDASAVMVNDHTAFRDDAMPFAGLSASGLGVGGIPYTIEEMQFEKMLVLKR